MKPFVLYTSFIDLPEREKLQEELDKGNMVKAVSNGSSQMRAEIVRKQGEAYFKSLGCVVVKKDPVHGDFYALPSKTTNTTKMNSGTKLSTLLALEDSPEKLRLLRAKCERLYEGHNQSRCLSEIERLSKMFE